MQAYGTILLGGLLLLCACRLEEKIATLTADFGRIDSLLSAAHAANRFHGGVVVGNQEGLLYESYWGTADRTWELPITDSTRFDIASLNKSFIAALVLLAAEEGKWRLEDKLVDQLSNFSYSGRFHPAITIHQLLCHTSGLPDYSGVGEKLAAKNFLEFKRKRFSNTEYVDFISQLEPMQEPGKAFHYSNFGYHLLCILLEKVYTQPFSEILHQKITRPLGLKHTVSASLNEEVISNLTEGYHYDADRGAWLRNEFIDLSLGRRIFSTPSDLLVWGQAMTDERLLSRTSLDVMQQNHLAAITRDLSYGYGWVVFGPDQHFRMGDLELSSPYLIHGGNTGGFKSMVVVVDEGKYILSLLTNTGNQINELALTKKILNILNID